MIGPFDILSSKSELLTKYRSYFDKLAIGSTHSSKILKEHFQAVHVYLRVLEYYSYTNPNEIEVDVTLLEDVYYELQKSLYLLDTKYYV